MDASGAGAVALRKPRRIEDNPGCDGRAQPTHYDRGVSNSRLVYSTDDGDQRRKPAAGSTTHTSAPNDGIVRVAREKAGRKGKTVTVVRGLPAADVAAVASDLKRHCGSGGTVKDGTIELQGDHREKAAARLSARGYDVKLAGG